VCDQLVTLGDLMGTCSQLVGAQIPAGEAEDTVSMLPLLEGSTQLPVRDFAVHHSGAGKFAIRSGPWVLIDAPSGGDTEEPDWFKRECGYEPHQHPGELFDLRNDVAERRNLYGEAPEVATRLSSLLERVKRDGRGPG
jgi:arylsulfatase A